MVTRRNFSIIVLTIFVSIMMQEYVLSGFLFRINVLSDIVTFLSIVFGFYITSLAIFITSRYVSDLYKITDENNQSLTLLHTLTNNYKFGLILTLISLIYFIGIQFFIILPEGEGISLDNWKLYPVVSLLVLNFGYCFFMLRDLIKIIVQEGKIRSQSNNI